VHKGTLASLAIIDTFLSLAARGQQPTTKLWPYTIFNTKYYIMCLLDTLIL